MSQFLTDPESGIDKSRPKVRGKKSTNFKEAVIKCLQLKGASERLAEVVVIDLGGMVTTYMHLKKSPTETADMLWPHVEKIYRRPDGTLGYSK